MLINKPNYNRGDIITIKLVNGDEIITKLVEETANHLTVSKPLIVNAGLVPTGEMHIMLMPWIFTIDDKTNLTIPKDKVMTITLSGDEAKKSYIKRTTGLEIASTLSTPK